MSKVTAEKPDREKLWSLGILAVCILFYLFFCIRYGVMLRSDSKGYMEMISAREPVYPLFLAFFRLIFGEENYLFPVILVQNLLMALCVWQFVVWAEKRYALIKPVSCLLVFINFGVELLCQYFADLAGTYPNTIMTEGICIPLWLLMLRLVTEYTEEGKKQPLLQIAVLAALLMDTRKQMAVAYLLLGAAVFFGRIGRDKGKRYVLRLVFTAAVCVLSVGVAILGTRLYNLVLRGSFVQNTRDMNLVVTTTLYSADPEDAELIKEDEVRMLFTETMERLGESESNYRYAGDGLTALTEHYEEHFDTITIETTGPLFLEYAINRGFAEGVEAEQEADRMSAVIVKALFPDNIGTYLRIYIASVINGLVNTVASRGALLDIYALVIYLLYIAVMILCLRKKETEKAGILGLTVLLSCAINAAVTAALIFCQSRYMIYNMAAFYMAGLIQLEVLIKCLLKKKRKKSQTKERSEGNKTESTSRKEKT